MPEAVDTIAAAETLRRSSSLLRAKAEATGNTPAEPASQDSGEGAAVAFPRQSRAGGGLLEAAPETSPGGTSAEAPSGQTTPPQMVKVNVNGTPLDLPLSEVERMVAKARNADTEIERVNLLREEAREAIAAAEWLRKKAPLDVRERVARAMQSDAQDDDDGPEDEDEPDEPAPPPRAESSREVARLRAEVEELKQERVQRQRAESTANGFKALEAAMDQHAAFKDPIVRELAKPTILGVLSANPKLDAALVISEYAQKYGALLVDRGSSPKTVAKAPAVPSQPGTRSSGPGDHGNTARTLGDKIAAMFGQKR